MAGETTLRDAYMEPITLTEEEQLAMQKLFAYAEDYASAWGKNNENHPDLGLSEEAYAALRAKFF